MRTLKCFKAACRLLPRAPGTKRATKGTLFGNGRRMKRGTSSPYHLVGGGTGYQGAGETGRL